MQGQAKAYEQEQVTSLIEARFAKSTTIPEQFFTSAAEQIAQACWAMAKRFHQGGRLLAFGNGACATDAQHVAVEFIHPVIVGKRALPAIALTNDSATMSGLMAGGAPTMPFTRQLQAIGRPQDIAIGYSPNGHCANVIAALEVAKQRGLLTLGLAGNDGGLMRTMGLDFCFVINARDPLVIQETHETLYHILWELVHIFFEHEGLL